MVTSPVTPTAILLWYGFGPQEETRLLTNSSGSVVDTYVYSAYGQPIASSGTDTNPFRYGGAFGYYTDAADTSGAVLCTYRWYDPNNGRWISRDKTGYRGGDNLFGYCANDPVNYQDPSGDGRRGPKRPPILEDPGHKPQGTGNKWEIHSGRRAGQKGNQNIGKRGYPSNPPSQRQQQKQQQRQQQQNQRNQQNETQSEEEGQQIENEYGDGVDIEGYEGTAPPGGDPACEDGNLDE